MGEVWERWMSWDMEKGLKRDGGKGFGNSWGLLEVGEGVGRRRGIVGELGRLEEGKSWRNWKGFIWGILKCVRKRVYCLWGMIWMSGGGWVEVWECIGCWE